MFRRISLSLQFYLVSSYTTKQIDFINYSFYTVNDQQKAQNSTVFCANERPVLGRKIRSSVSVRISVHVHFRAQLKLGGKFKQK